MQRDKMMHKLIAVLVVVAAASARYTGDNGQRNGLAVVRVDRDVQTEVPGQFEVKREGCGWSNPKGLNMNATRDVNGQTKFAEFPWIVAVLVNNPEEPVLTLWGGGSLIHHSIVLTTARVAQTSNKLVVRAGEWNIKTQEEQYPYQDRYVGKIVKHKDADVYDPTPADKYMYNVALLFLKTPVEVAPNVGIACLPPPSETTAMLPGTRCFATGWGEGKLSSKDHYADILKKMEVPAVSRFECRTKLRSSLKQPEYRLPNTVMCAGGEWRPGPRNHDGGSPLVCPIQFEDDRYLLSGMFSWYISNDDDAPEVYTDVATVRSWIDEQVKGQGFDDSAIRGYTYTFSYYF